MPAQRQLPDNEVLVRLRRQGWSYDAIAAEFAVTRGAVYLRLKQVSGATTQRPDYSHLIPWVVAKRHTQAVPVNMLRLLGRRQNGEELTQRNATMLDNWLAKIAEADVVVCYDPEMGPNPASPTAGGFYYSRRRKSDGDSLVRVPEGVPVRE